MEIVQKIKERAKTWSISEIIALFLSHILSPQKLYWEALASLVRTTGTKVN